jgi:DNA-binding transcriptional regulator PaaX
MATMATWVFLAYRLPREPSRPRLALWRALKRLGAGLIVDGVAALPESPRNVEHFEWLGVQVEENGGTASVWLARPRTRAAERALVAELRDAVETDYAAVRREAESVVDEGEVARRRAVRTLRRALGRIGARDYFEAPGARAAREAVDALQRTVVAR